MWRLAQASRVTEYQPRRSLILIHDFNKLDLRAIKSVAPPFNTMATVADELLADLEDTDDELEDEVENGEEGDGADAEMSQEQADEDADMQDEANGAATSHTDPLPKGTIPSTGLNATLKPVLAQIEHFQNAFTKL